MLAFANDRVEPGRYLRALAVEQRGIRRALESLVDQHQAQVHLLANATVSDIVEAFSSRAVVDRVVVFHYGGHADDSALHLESDDGGRAAVSADLLAEYLACQSRLALVFLNGCATNAQVRRLRELGVKAVVATSRAIKDEIASDFARLFYQHLRVLPLGEAFERAVAAAKLAIGQGAECARDAYREDYRDLVPSSPREEELLEWPWVLDCESGSERWRLVPETPTRSRLGTGAWSALGGATLMLVALAAKLASHCLPIPGEVALVVLFAVGTGLSTGAVVGAVMAARRGARRDPADLRQKWKWDARVGAIASVLAAGGIFFGLPRAALHCEAEPSSEETSKAPVPTTFGATTPDNDRDDPPPPDGMVYVRPGSLERSGASIEDHYRDCRNAYGDECSWQTFERERRNAGSFDVAGFFLDRHEVTNAELAIYMRQLHNRGEAEIVEGQGLKTVGERPPRALVSFGFSADESLVGAPYQAFAGGSDTLEPARGMANRPATLVTWDLASRYCRSQNKRLPTENEWEYAARGPDGREYVWGDERIRCHDAAYGRVALASNSVECRNEEKRPNRVGGSPIDSAVSGARDLGANVSEWVADAFVDPQRGCPPSATEDDTGSASCHVYKGGNWVDPLIFTRLAYRPIAPPNSRFVSVGFRCAASPKKEP
jgi:formylglycine-generating enzyme required for sulfatase activity